MPITDHRDRPITDDDPIKPHERRALNFLINEYLLRHGYKHSSIAFSDENEDQDVEDWDDVGLNVTKPPELLHFFREGVSRPTEPPPPPLLPPPPPPGTDCQCQTEEDPLHAQLQNDITTLMDTIENLESEVPERCRRAVLAACVAEPVEGAAAEAIDPQLEVSQLSSAPEQAELQLARCQSPSVILARRGSDPVEVMEEEPTAGPSGSAAVPGLERVKLDMSEAEAEGAVYRDDLLGLVEKQLSRTLLPVLRRCDEVLSRPNGVKVSAITARQRRRLGRVDGKDITPRVEIATGFVKLEVEEHEMEDDPAWTISEIQGSHASTQPDDAASGMTSLKEEPSDTPGLTMTVDVKEEQLSAATSYSSDHDIPKRAKHCVYNSIVLEECETRPVTRHQGHIRELGKDNYEREYCTTEGTNSITTHRAINKGWKPYRCDDCGKTFIKRRYLFRHYKTHGGEKPLKCDDCGKTFVYKSRLEKHRRIHSGEKPFKCDYCGKTFSRHDNLNVHRRIHPGVKPYKCDDCGQTFTQKSSLTVHRRNTVARSSRHVTTVGTCLLKQVV